MKRIGILGVPMDLGQGRRGVDMGPSALRYARLQEVLEGLGHSVLDYGDVDVPVVESLRPSGGGGLVYLEAIRKACLETIETLGQMSPETFPVVLGGDHSIAMGSVTGASRGERVGVIWVDAHADFNTPQTSPSGNIHGMPLAHLCGLGDPRLANLGAEGPTVRFEDVALIGIRSLDPGEVAVLREHGMSVYSMKEIDRLRIPEVAAAVLERFQGFSRVHVSLDADVLDPEVAPGVGTPVPGGLTYREAHLLMELFADAGIVTSLDLVEVNPILDRENRTARIMVELASSLLGKKIY
ncbi:arginase [Meiothermus granaticius]|uniref:Arginase n=1 Tax=Meiothermus granaticius NBRC 107808 TaxID=1227551 RepID=A0A399FA12_9DEIN|nr:arginase [Meiothermus granaticius]MCL6525342.1 arginase [Thermaceae bacterium]RIH92943.1 Arginase [Meiothermus granaticius NBRC 107808]GEM86219.1 arginase [Meiothermus granaticius NBRC 107808]